MVTNSHHPLKKESTVSLIELLEHPALIREIGSGTRQIFEGFCREHGCVIQLHRQMGSHQAIKTALASGQHFAVLPEAMVSAEITAGHLAIIPVMGFPIRRSWCTVYPKGKHLNPLTAAFQDFLHRHII